MTDEAYLSACDLMFEDLCEVHSRIRSMAKENACERELDIIKNELLEYLRGKRNS